MERRARAFSIRRQGARTVCRTQEKKKGLGGSALSQGGAIATKRDDSWDGQSGPWIWTSPPMAGPHPNGKHGLATSSAPLVGSWPSLSLSSNKG